ncbi:FAD-dependent oxidoreductase [Geodermatophilus ruber]|uniref:FAD dependent oxidoreductase n=1 Tax=Geodermatophilus ruber TaxID=504800 RepID=A0A1I4AIU2_9ACTN|nr:FAD-dependent oxidoreductase [Geodermatophilus ruber]SFK56274.1 FAD dependent oxidoreductase [Geodermatophilus ruber]
MSDLSSTVDEPDRTVPVLRDTDVLVVGGGPAGVCAAVAAARTGARVLLMERAGFLGGTATGGMVAAWNGFFWRDVRVTGGIAYEIVERLRAAGGGHPSFVHHIAGELTDSPLGFETFPFDPEILKFVLDDLVGEAGVQVLHHVHAAALTRHDRAVDTVIYEGPTARGGIRAHRVIDATGSGTIAFKAGASAAPMSLPTQPMTLMMRLSGVNRDELAATAKAVRREIVHAGVERGSLFYRTLAVSWSPSNGDAFLLMTSVNGKDAADEFELTGAEIEGRRQARSTLAYLREHMPGFASAQLVQLAPWIGVRESRRVLGEYVLTGDDVLTGRAFSDAVSWGGGPLDLHEGHSVSLTSPQRPFAVPYRCLLPLGIDNMLVTGRAVSADSAGMGGLRHMGGVMPVGEAAGVAAALSLAAGLRPRELSVDDLRNRLRRAGVIVDSPVGR